jgi:hypothetical protein
LSGCFESLYVEIMYKYQVFLCLYQKSDDLESKVFTTYEEFLEEIPGEVLYTSVAIIALMDGYAKYSK